jgi:Cytochrome c7 and related cytochrome c
VGSLGFKAVINGLYSVGVQQGYAPKQPIAFSHKLHAGAYEIDCNYCHTGAMKGKSATIPSVNICMNCHRAVKTESPLIQKLWAAADWQPETLSFGPNQKPIEWVRIHNLPDLAYFNHSQHVSVAGLECQTCHGPIQEMDVVKQYSLLTMGWCIDCHRKTDVNAKGNAYYDKLVELHKAANKEPMKVQDNGGLECAKCHY